MENRQQTINSASTIFLVVQSLTLIGLLIKSKYDNVFDVITITVLFLIYSFFKAKYNWYINNYITWAVIITIVGHNLIGEYYDVYLSSFIYDKILHFFGTYAFSLFFYSIITQLLPAPLSSKKRELLFIAFLGTSLGAAFEIIEFLVDIIHKPKVPNQNNLLDTDLDLIANIIGSLMAAVHTYVKNFRIFQH